MSFLVEGRSGKGKQEKVREKRKRGKLEDERHGEERARSKDRAEDSEQRATQPKPTADKAQLGMLSAPHITLTHTTQRSEQKRDWSRSPPLVPRSL